ncbi:MAG: hypothetical protein ABSC48_01145 [Terracidiphilus sp.]|jgi:hypothetical protein
MLRRIAGIGVLLLGCGLAAAAWAETGKAEKPAPLYGPHGVSPQAVLQGSLGSCYFHATIAALAKATPETLRGAIRENPGGGYRVHFFSGPEEVVFPEDVEFGRTHSYDRSEGMWVGVLMRGYAQRALRQSLVGAIQKSDMIPVFTKPMALTLLDASDLPLVAYDRAVRAVVQQDGVLDKASLKTKLATQLSALGVPASEAEMLGGFLDEQGFFDSVSKTVEQNGEVFGAYKSLGQGGVPGWVFEAFLGKGEAGMVADKKLTIGQLQQLHAGKVAIVAGTWSTPPSDDVAKASWWVPSHAYTVLEYDAAAQTVTLRNPWAAKPDPDGVFTLSLPVFLDSYESYTYTQTPAP